MPEPRDDQHLPAGATPSGAGPTAPVPLEPPKVPIADLPVAYQDDRLVLLVRDPRTLFCYWDLHPKTISDVGPGTPMLRLFGLSRGGSEVVRELEVELAWMAFYLYELEPNRDYRVELFVRTLAGDRRLGRISNVASLPPNKPSSWIEDRFATLGAGAPLPSSGQLEATVVEGERRAHVRAWELSGGEEFATGDVAGSSLANVKGFGGRAWSGSMIGSGSGG